MTVKFHLNKAEHIPLILAAIERGELQAQQDGFLPNHACAYIGPCAIGVVMPRDLAIQIEAAGGATIAQLKDHWDDFITIDEPYFWGQAQGYHDEGDIVGLVEHLKSGLAS